MQAGIETLIEWEGEANMIQDGNGEINKKNVAVISILLAIVLISVLIFELYSFESAPHNLSDTELGIVDGFDDENSLNNKSQTDNNHKDLDKENSITQIALFGIDKRNESEKTSRSDAMMIVTLDNKNQKLKVTSLMRDQLVEIDGRGKDKLNHAYAYGGPTLAIKTINQNFGTNIRDYVVIDFSSMQEIVDSIGGIEVDVRSVEIPQIDKYASEIADIDKKNYTSYKKGEKLNGQQALAYSRIRNVGDGDFERTDRQRKVAHSLLNTVKDRSVIQLINTWTKVSSHIETSMSKSKVTKLASDYLSKGPFTWEESRYPKDGTWKAKYLNNGMWVMEVDLEKQKKEIRDYLKYDKKIDE